MKKQIKLKSLKPLLSKVANACLATYLISQGVDSTLSNRFGQIAEGLISSIDYVNTELLSERLLRVLKDAIRKTFIRFESKFVVTEENMELIIEKILNFELLRSYLSAYNADELFIANLTDALDMLDIPHREHKIDLSDIALGMMRKIDESIINDHELSLVKVLYTVESVNQQITRLSLKFELIEKYLQPVDNAPEIFDEKEKLIRKWNNALFLHENIQPSLVLSDIYQPPEFKYEGKRQSNIDLFMLSFLDDPKHKSLLIVGNPGLGKSSLMCYFANLYNKQRNFYFIRMKSLETSIARKSLLEAIIALLGCKRNDLENGVLFLDGYDELRVDNLHYDLCIDLFADITSIEGLKVVLSSRLNYIDLNKEQFKSDFPNTLSIEVLPFVKEQMYQYISSYSNVTNKDLRNLRKQIESTQIPIEVFGIPFILYLVCTLDIYIYEISNINEIYDKVFYSDQGLYEKIYDKGGHYLTENAIVKKQLLEISELISYEMYKSNLLYVEKDRMESEIRSRYPKRILDYAIGNYYIIENNQLMFYHKTFQEYFVCKYLISQLRDIAAKWIETQNEDQYIFSMLRLFYCDNFLYKRLLTQMTKELSEEKEIHTALKANHVKTVGSFLTYPYSKFGHIDYDRFQSCISSICKIINIVLGQGWAAQLSDGLSSRYLSQLLVHSGYIHMSLDNLFLTDADVTGAYMRRYFQQCRFLRCNLSRTDIQGSRIQNSRFMECLIHNAYVERTEFSSTIFHKSKFFNSNFMNTSFERTTIFSCEINYGVWINSKHNYGDIKDTNFTNSDMKNVEFIGSSLSSVTFQDVNLSNTFFYRVKPRNISFRRCKMNESTFEGISTLAEMYFVDCDLSGAVFDESIEIKELQEALEMNEFTHVYHGEKRIEWTECE